MSELSQPANPLVINKPLWILLGRTLTKRLSSAQSFSLNSNWAVLLCCLAQSNVQVYIKEVHFVSGIIKVWLAKALGWLNFLCCLYVSTILLFRPLPPCEFIMDLSEWRRMISAPTSGLNPPRPNRMMVQGTNLKHKCEE